MGRHRSVAARVALPLLAVALAVVGFGAFRTYGLAWTGWGGAGTDGLRGRAGAVTVGVPDLSGTARLADLPDSGFLQVVNAQYAVSLTPANLTTAWPGVAVADTAERLDRTALAGLAALLKAASAAGVGEPYLSSGYRDHAQQQRTYDATADKSRVQPAGHSEHETGLAADIAVPGVTQADLAASSAGRWLADNAWRFGFVLRYPADKQGVTGIAGEAWHFRYVGQPHAWYCHKAGLALEEYVQFLRETGGYRVDLDGVTYSVAYETANDGILRVPTGGDVIVSSDNGGGFIVTGRR